MLDGLLFEHNHFVLDLPLETFAGAVGDESFRDGPTAVARLENGDLAAGVFGIAIASQKGAVRLLEGGGTASAALRTIVGSDQRTEDGRLLEARLVQPADLACGARRCVVSEPILGTYRLIDTDSGLVSRVHGREVDTVPMGPIAVSLDDAGAFDFVVADGPLTRCTVGGLPLSPDAARSEQLPTSAAFIAARSLLVVDGTPATGETVLVARPTGSPWCGRTAAPSIARWASRSTRWRRRRGPSTTPPSGAPTACHARTSRSLRWT
jgi:hypothetical protein